MGCMSASDAAPLPRLGEVFFDVRGNSRSMRLSWYADTGVAVFSIWQGGTCTGTFRLPMDDLARMIEALRRGPQGGQRAARDGAPPSRAAASQDPGQATVAMRRPEGESPARTYRRDPAGYPDPLSPEYPAEPLEDYRTGAGSGEFRAVSDAGYPELPVTGDYRRTGPELAYPDEAASDPYRRDGYPQEYRDSSSGSHRQDRGGYPAGPAELPGRPAGQPPAGWARLSR